MVDLASYRASIKNLIETENLPDAFVAEGIDAHTADLISKSKGFRASRSDAAETKRKKS